MSEVKPRQWFQARLRRAVLEEGHGLYRWREAEHIFSARTGRQRFKSRSGLGMPESTRLFLRQTRKMLQRSTAGLPRWSTWKN